MASNKRIKRQRQRRKRIERDAVTAVAGNEADQQQFVDKDADNNGEIQIAEKSSESNMQGFKTGDKLSRISSVWSWASAWVEKTIASSRLLSVDSFSQVTNMTTASKSVTIILVLLLSLVMGNFDHFVQTTTRLGLPSVSTSVAFLYTAILVSLVLPFMAGYMICNASRTNNTITTTNAVQDENSENMDDEFAVIRSLGLKPTCMISFGDTNGDSSSPPLDAQLASSIGIRTKLAEWLPFGLRYTSDLNLVFSTNVHGRSLETLYHILEATSSTHTILLLEAFLSSTSKRMVIGMYVSQRWHSSPKIYGDGRCFLFRLCEENTSNSSQCWKWTPPVLPSHHLSTSQNVRKNHDTTNDNNLSLWETFQRSNRNSLSLGVSPCGVGAGLQLNHDMTMGESHRAVGFDNEPLCSHNAETAKSSCVFDVGLVEVYQLVRELDGRPIQS